MKHLPLLSSALLCALALVPTRSQAAWWKGLNWTKNGSLNADYWEGFSISYENWYAAGGHDSVTDTLWAETEAVFEGQENPYTVILDADFACRNVTAFQSYSGGSMTMNLSGYTFSTVHGAWGFFFKGNENELVITNGTVSIRKGFNVGDDNGNRNTAILVDATMSYPEAVSIGRGTSTGNRLVVGSGGCVLVSNQDGHGGWGICAGERAGENGNILEVRDGGVVTNVAAGLYIGQNSSGNLLDIQNGGRVYRENYMHLGRVDDTALQPKDNMVRIEGAGSVLEVHSQFCIGENVQTSFKGNHNVFWVGDRGTFQGSNDFFIFSSDNDVVVSNGLLRLGGGFRTTTADDNGVTGTRVVLAGESPAIITGYDVTFRNASTLCLKLPTGGYRAPADWDSATLGDYAPMRGEALFNIGDDTALELDLSSFRRPADRPITFDVMRLNSFGNMFGISDAKLAAWNASLPEGFSIGFKEGHANDTDGNGWCQKILAMTVKPLNYTTVLIR